MSPDSFPARLADYVLSGHAYLHVPTTEKTRFLAELEQLAEALPDGGRIAESPTFAFALAFWQN